MRIEVEAIFSVELAQRHQDKIFVFGDNLAQRGRGGQAIIRFEPNTFGVPTKRSPRMDDDAFFSDREDERQALIAALRKLYRLGESHTLVFPKAGLGTGLAQMERRSPELFALMGAILSEHFGFDQRFGTVRRMSAMPAQ